MAERTVDTSQVWSRFLQEYELLLLLVGVALLLTTLGRTWLDRFRINTSFVYVLVGLAFGPLWLSLAPSDPLDAMPVLERVAEIGVTLSLIVIGIRIGRPLSWRAWRSTTRLVLVVMPLTIAAVALSGTWLLGLALGPAILLAAILAPTDPIMAGPLEEHSLRDESEERFGLSSEAGLNDGLAFPFIYLGLYATWNLSGWEGWLPQWFLRDLLYAVLMALPLGWLLGRLCGAGIARQDWSDTRRKRGAFTPLALLLLSYGLVEALGGYGFLAAFTAGLGFRQAMREEEATLERFANFTESLDELLKAALLMMLAALLRWQDLAAAGPALLGFALLLILVWRPLGTVLATAGGRFRWRDRGYWAWFGLRGIGSMFYLAYAINAGLEESIARQLFAATAATILCSVVLHGLSLPLIRQTPEQPWTEAGTAAAGDRNDAER